jgi:hypothetical protein
MQRQGSGADMDRWPVAGTEGAIGSGSGAMFCCPRCQQEYPLRFLVSRWSEWGQICWCAGSGELDLACPVFNTGPQHTVAER